jgi:predicted alpha/beta superfamily hydrolase
MPALKPAFVVLSPQTGTVYPIYAAVPPATEPGPHAAVVFLDGDDQFRPAVAAYLTLRDAGAVPPLALFGVGYGASYTKPGNYRLRDYTPTKIATEPGSGGAEPFLSFLTETLWPELARRHPLRADVRGLAGHSLGSLLVVHALLQRRPFFTHHLASAPSLWWDNRAVICHAQNHQRTGAALPAKLFLSVGDEDSESMTGDLTLFEDQLAALPFPQLEVISRRHPQRNHFNVLPEAFAAGLAALFAPPDAPGSL